MPPRFSMVYRFETRSYFLHSAVSDAPLAHHFAQQIVLKLLLLSRRGPRPSTRFCWQSCRHNKISDFSDRLVKVTTAASPF
jgi:hypothetical protein